MEAVIARIGKLDFIIFDNIMSLTVGDMKDEKGWSETLPWVKSLTKRMIGQLWVHHTGHDDTKSYGAKTREWQMDTVIGLIKEGREDSDVSFKLAFTKARQRTPETREDYVEKKVALVNDRWVFAAAGRAPSEISPLAKKYYDALCSVVAGGDKANNMNGHPAASLKDWQAECIKTGLLEKEPGKAGLDSKSRSKFGKYKLELIAGDRIACNDTMAWVLP